MHAEDLTSFYAGAIEEGLRFIKLLPHSKCCGWGSWEGNVLQSAESIEAALKKGDNIGFLLVGKGGLSPNPLGIWGLDIDSKAAADRYSDAQFTLMVSRGHEYKRHYLARLPDPSAPRKSRNVRKSHDVKLTGVLVAPGSRHAEGGTYTLFVRNPETRVWMPWDGTPIDWAAIPVVDPAPFIPTTTVLIPLQSELLASGKGCPQPEWVFKETQVPAEWASRPFTVARGAQYDREIRADGYIRSRIKAGIVSKAGEGGRATLLTLAIHLVRYLRLPDDIALAKLACPVHGADVAWNDLCIDGDSKKPYPWTLEEILSAISAAHSYVPYFGVIEHIRFQDLLTGDQRLDHFLGLLAHLDTPTDGSPSMSAKDLYRLFVEMYNINDQVYRYRRFTWRFQKALRAKTLRLENARGSGRKRLRHYRGVSAELVDFALELSSFQMPASTLEATPLEVEQTPSVDDYFSKNSATSLHPLLVHQASTLAIREALHQAS